MIKVNLVPADILAKAEQRQQAMQAAAGGACLAVLLGLVSWAHYHTYTSMEEQLAKDKAQLKLLQKEVELVKNLDAEKKTVKAKLDAISNLHRGRLVYPNFMADFVRSVPPGVRVKTLSTTGGGSNADPLKLNITAEARTNRDIKDWVQGLEGTGKFSGVDLGAISAGVSGTQTVLSFTMTSVYTPTL